MLDALPTRPIVCLQADSIYNGRVVLGNALKVVTGGRFEAAEGEASGAIAGRSLALCSPSGTQVSVGLPDSLLDIEHYCTRGSVEGGARIWM